MPKIEASHKAKEAIELMRSVADWKAHLPGVQMVQTHVASMACCQVEMWVLH